MKRFVCEYARQFHDVAPERASAAAVVCDVMFDPQASDANKLKAADMVMRYTEAPIRAIEGEKLDSGPEFEISILGVCNIKGRPLLDQPVEVAEGEFKEVVEADNDT